MYATDDVNWAGRTGPNACLGPSTSPASFCLGAHSWAGYGVDLGDAPEDSTVVLDGFLNLTWEPDTDATEDLRIRLILCEAECDASDATPINTTGSSPLNLNIDQVTTDVNRRVHLIVDVPPNEQGPIQMKMSTDQSFTATGRLTVRAP